MSLKEQIQADVKSAMKERDSERLTALRSLQSSIKNKEIESRPNEITDNDILDVIKKTAKKHKDSIDQFKAAGREDLVEKESFELSLIEKYLPAQMGEAEVKAIVVKAIETVGATSMKEMGAVMKEVMAQTQGAADNKLISQIVRDSLS
ncbi:MAG: GatB/YqeY domain-containing protein [Bdellovibrionales bacterium]|nr:GatB/YqeY domain-containing protein [Bdellovibrionales bacterium]